MTFPGEIERIFPAIIPALATVLSCFSILVAVAGRMEVRGYRLLGILSLVTAAYNIGYAGLLITGSGFFSILNDRFILSVTFFFVPLSIHLCSVISGGRPGKHLTGAFYGIIVFLMAVFWWNAPLARAVFPVIASTGLIICAILLRKTPENGNRRPLLLRCLLLSGIAMLLILGSLPLFVSPAINPLAFAFLPLTLLSLVTVMMDENGNGREIVKEELIQWLIAAFIMVPVICDVMIIALNREIMNLGTVATGIISFGIVKLLSIVICSWLAYFSFTKKEDRVEGSLLFVICMIMVMVNLKDTIALLPTGLPRQICILNDIFIIISAGVSVHLAHYISRKPGHIAVPLFYGLTVILILLLTGTILPGGMSIGLVKNAGEHYHPLLMGTLLIAFSHCAAVLWKTWRHETDPDRKTSLKIFLTGLAIAAFFQIFNVLGSLGIALIPIHVMLVIPLMIIVYGLTYEDLQNMSASTKKELLAKGLKALLVILYLAFLPVFVWLFREYGADYLTARIVPYGIPPLLSFLCAAFLSLFVLGLEQNRMEAILFSLISFCYAILNLDILLVAVIPDIALALKVSRLDHFFLALIMLGVNLHLIYLVTGEKTRWWIVYAGYLIGLVMAPLSQTRYYYQGMYTYYWGYFARKAILFDIMSALWISGLFYAIFMLYQEFRRMQVSERTTVRRVLIAFLILAGLSISNIPTINGIEFYPLGTFAFIGLIYLAYGLFKFNLRTAMQDIRSIIYFTGLTAILTGIGLLPGLILHQEGTPSLVMGILVAALLYRPLGKVWNASVNLFVRNERDTLGDEYNRLIEELSHVHHIREIHLALKEWSFRVFSCRCCSLIVLKEDEDTSFGWTAWNPLASAGLFDNGNAGPQGEHFLRIDARHPLIRDAHRSRTMVVGNMLAKMVSELPDTDKCHDLFNYVELLIPIITGDRTVALLLIGGKNDGSGFRRSEIDLLRSASLALGPHVENALLLESLEDEVEKRTRDLNATLVEARLKEKEISARNEVILRQNRIMAALLETATRIHRIDDLEELFTFTLGQLRSLFPDLSGGIILEDMNRNILEASAFIGLDENEQKVILENRYRITDPAIDTILCDELALQGIEQAPECASLWRVFPLQEKAEREAGYLILKGKDLDGPTGEIVILFIGQISAVVQNRLLMAHLEKMASTDGLTGIYNRAFLDQELHKVIKFAQRLRSMWFSLMIIDVNGLKQVNDTYGHGVGDEVIVKVAGMLKSVCRETDIVSRIGGDEFAVLMPSTNRNQAQILLSRIRKGERGLQVLLILPDGTYERILIKVSIGLASSDEIDPAEVMKRADDLMYSDKQRYYLETKTRSSGLKGQ
jgi:diguanylate cyclase (GGDEF)-like protein